MSKDAISVFKAKKEDLDVLKAIADANRNALGFLLKPKPEEAISKERVLAASYEDSLVGFVIFRHRRKDLQTTLSDICVRLEWRRVGIGTTLVETLKTECIALSREFIQLKCPEDLVANEFYCRLGFQLVGIDKGRSRRLNIWRLLLIPKTS